MNDLAPAPALAFAPAPSVSLALAVALAPALAFAPAVAPALALALALALAPALALALAALALSRLLLPFLAPEPPNANLVSKGGDEIKVVFRKVLLLLVYTVFYTRRKGFLIIQPSNPQPYALNPKPGQPSTSDVAFGAEANAKHAANPYETAAERTENPGNSIDGSKFLARTTSITPATITIITLIICSIRFDTPQSPST